MTTDDETRYGPTSGLVSGWIAVVLCAALAVVLPFAGQDRTTLRFAVGAALAALVIWAYTARPRIIMRPGTLVLRNPWSTWLVPVGLVDDVHVRLTTRVMVAGRSYEGVAVGKALRVLSGAKPRSWGTVDPVPDLLEERVLAAAESARAVGSPAGEVVRVWAVPELVVVAVLGVVELALVL